MNCTADVRADSCEVWAPTQNAQDAQQKARSLTKLTDEAIQVHVPLIGGAFGRRLSTDYVAEAVQVSQAVQAPVQVLWTREDDIRHDLFHPLSYHYARANVDEPDRLQIKDYNAQGAILTTYFRSVGNIPDAFVHECFLDELAAASIEAMTSHARRLELDD